MFNFNRRSPTHIKVPINHPGVITINPYDHRFAISLTDDIVQWLREHVGREALSLPEIIRADSDTEWFFNYYLSGNPKLETPYHLMYFADKKKAALFKLSWV